MREIQQEEFKIYLLNSGSSYIYNLQVFDSLDLVKISDSGDHSVKTLSAFVQDVSSSSEPGLLVSPNFVNISTPNVSLSSTEG